MLSIELKKKLTLFLRALARIAFSSSFSLEGQFPSLTKRAETKRTRTSLITVVISSAVITLVFTFRHPLRFGCRSPTDKIEEEEEPRRRKEKKKKAVTPCQLTKDTRSLYTKSSSSSTPKRRERGGGASDGRCAPTLSLSFSLSMWLQPPSSLFLPFRKKEFA